MNLIREDPFTTLIVLMVERPTQMGRESNDQIVIHSSIALLQERFRKLEKVKEMREGRELSIMRTSSSQYSERCNPPPLPVFRHHHQYEPSKLFFQSEILIPPPSQRVPVSLWPGSQIKRSGFRGVETLELMNSTSWPTDKPLVEDPQMTIKFHDSDSDVDTSLHL